MSLTLQNNKEKLIELLTLSSIDGIGAVRLYQLIAKFGSATAVLKASINDLTDLSGIGREIATNIIKKQDRQQASEIIDKIETLGWQVYLYDEPTYPEPLKNINDRPPFLFSLGEYDKSDLNAIAIIGSRISSEEGRLFAEKLAADLAGHGVTIVSGMARGVDTAAHRGALNAGGRTIAVFGSSLDILYPPEGREIAKSICNNGCIFSEYLPGTKPEAHNFPERNRIISGLSQGVVVIEAAQKSGTLSTVAHAIALNREIFAVPGAPRSEFSKGTNQLLKEGARLITSCDDIFAELPRLKGPVPVKDLTKIEDLTDTERTVLQCLADKPMHIDQISRDIETPVPDLMQILLALELKGIIKELSGKRYILN